MSASGEFIRPDARPITGPQDTIRIPPGSLTDYAVNTRAEPANQLFCTLYLAPRCKLIANLASCLLLFILFVIYFQLMELFENYSLAFFYLFFPARQPLYSDNYRAFVESHLTLFL